MRRTVSQFMTKNKELHGSSAWFPFSIREVLDDLGTACCQPNYALHRLQAVSEQTYVGSYAFINFKWLFAMTYHSFARKY